MRAVLGSPVGVRRADHGHRLGAEEGVQVDLSQGDGQPGQIHGICPGRRRPGALVRLAGRRAIGSLCLCRFDPASHALLVLVSRFVATCVSYLRRRPPRRSAVGGRGLLPLWPGCPVWTSRRHRAGPGQGYGRAESLAVAGHRGIETPGSFDPRFPTSRSTQQPVTVPLGGVFSTGPFDGGLAPPVAGAGRSPSDRWLRC